MAVIYDAKDATAATVGTRIMPAVMKENDIKIANENDLLSFNTGDLDVSAQVTKMKSLNPDGVVVSADYSQGVTVIREMKRQGLIKPVVGATQLISSAILKAAPGNPDRRPRHLLCDHERREGARNSSASCSRCCARPRASGGDRAQHVRREHL